MYVHICVNMCVHTSHMHVCVYVFVSIIECYLAVSSKLWSACWDVSFLSAKPVFPLGFRKSSENACLPREGRIWPCAAGAPWHGLTGVRGLRRPVLVPLLLMPVYQIIERQAAFLPTCFLLQGLCNLTRTPSSHPCTGRSLSRHRPN